MPTPVVRRNDGATNRVPSNRPARSLGAAGPLAEFGFVQLWSSEKAMGVWPELRRHTFPTAAPVAEISWRTTDLLPPRDARREVPTPDRKRRFSAAVSNGTYLGAVRLSTVKDSGSPMLYTRAAMPVSPVPLGLKRFDQKGELCRDKRTRR